MTTSERNTTLKVAVLSEVGGKTHRGAENTATINSLGAKCDVDYKPIVSR
jgi:hypothetical protein